MIRLNIQADTEDLMALILALGGTADDDIRETILNFLKEGLEVETNDEEKKVNLKERTKIGF